MLGVLPAIRRGFTGKRENAAPITRDGPPRRHDDGCVVFVDEERPREAAVGRDLGPRNHRGLDRAVDLAEVGRPHTRRARVARSALDAPFVASARRADHGQP